METECTQPSAKLTLAFGNASLNSIEKLCLNGTRCRSPQRKLDAHLALNPLGLLHHWCSRVADGDAFVQILPQECFAAAEPLMLCRMCKLVNGQTALVPVVVANKNAVT